MVRPSLEYASVVWDPHTKSNIQKIEKIQRLAARFIYSRYRRRDSPSAMLQLANLEPLEDRRRAARLNLLRLIYFSKLEIKPENYMVKDSSRPSRHKHSCSIKPIFARTNLYKHSFFPKSISEWNLLPRNSTLLSFSPWNAPCVSWLSQYLFDLTTCCVPKSVVLCLWIVLQWVYSALWKRV